MYDLTVSQLHENQNKDESEDLICLCVICGNPTGEMTTARSHTTFYVHPDNPMIRCARDGVCKHCHQAVRSGHTAFFTNTRGVILTKEANKRIDPAYHGLAIKIPEEKMDEVLASQEKGPDAEPENEEA